MYQPSYIKIQNIGPIKNMDFNFETGKSLLIQGKNLDNKGQRNNGAGKTFFIDSIAFCLTGITLSGRPMEEFIRDSENKAYLELCLQDSINNNQLIIKRFLDRKSAQVIEINLAGIDEHKNLSDVNSRNAFIIKEIGIPTDDLFKFFLISKDRYKPYFKLSDTDKKAITARFSNADVVDNTKPLIEADLLISNKNLTDLTLKRQKIEVEIENHLKFIEELENNSSTEFKESLKKDFQNKINEILELKKTYEDECVEFESVVLLNKTKIDEIELKKIKLETETTENKYKLKSVEDVYNKSFNLLNVKISERKQKTKTFEDNVNFFKQEILKLKETKSEINSLVTDTEIKLTSSIECPSCNHEFFIKSNTTVDELKNVLKELKDTLSVVLDEIEKNEKLYLVACQDLKSEEQDVANFIKKLESTLDGFRVEKNDIQNQITTLSSEIFNLNNEINSITLVTKTTENKIKIKKQLQNDCSVEVENYESEIIKVDSMNEKDTIKKYKQFVIENEEKLIDVNKSIVLADDEIRKLNEWILKFKSFKSYLVNLSLKNIEELTNFYLGKMETDLSVEIDGYKQKGKKITEKITETILRGGIPVGSYSRFSGGERGRIDVGSILANQTLINNNASPKGLDLILIDEVLESVDEIGIKSIINSMDKVDKTMLLITQNEINTLPNQVITFEKQNGETKIV